MDPSRVLLQRPSSSSSRGRDCISKLLTDSIVEVLNGVLEVSPSDTPAPRSSGRELGPYLSGSATLTRHRTGQPSLAMISSIDSLMRSRIFWRLFFSLLTFPVPSP